MKKACILGMAILLTGLFTVACETNPDEIAGDYWVRFYGLNDCCTPFVRNVPDDVRIHNTHEGMIAWEGASLHFLTADGRWTDDFGGVFIDGNGFYNISVVGDRRPVKSDYLIYRQVHNSHNFLSSIKNEIGGIMIENTVWTVEVNEICNRVSIYLENEEKIHSLVEHLRTRNLLRHNTLRIYVGPNAIVRL